MVANTKIFNFEKLVHDQIIASANAPPSNRLVLPNLIDQLLRYQCIVLSRPGDHISATPLTFQLNKNSASLYRVPHPPKQPSLADDLKQLAHILRGIQLKALGMYSD